MANVTIYTHNMPIRQISQEDRKLLISTIIKYHSLVGVNFAKDAELKVMLVHNQAEIIIKCYPELTLEEIETAFLKAYNVELKGVKDKDIKTNPAKVLNAFRSFKSEQQAHIKKLEQDSEEVRQAKNEAYIQEVMNRVQEMIKANTTLNYKDLSGVILYEYAAYYDVIKELYPVKEETKNSVELAICSQWINKMAQQKGVKEQNGITIELYSAILDAWNGKIIHQKLYALASVEIRACLFTHIINTKLE